MKKNIFIASVLAILIMTNIVTMYMLRQSRRLKVTNPYPLVDLSRSFIEQRNFIVNLSPLKKELEQHVSQLEGATVSAYIEFLNTGANINIHPDVTIWPASMLKMPIILAAGKKIDDGVWQWHNELVLFEQDKDSGSGELYKKPNGTRFTIEDLVRETIVNSDNTAPKILVRNMVLQDFLDVADELGMDKLFDANEKIRVKDYARIFRALYTSSYLRRETSQKILTYLAGTNLNEFLSHGMPQETVFAHKIAIDTKKKVFGDAGIVYLADRPYLINVMVEVAEDDEQETMEFLRDFSKLTFEYFNNYD